LYVHGNHEAYDSSVEQLRLELAAACERWPNVRWLDGGEFQLAGVRFLGTTLWTDFRLFGEARQLACMQAAERVLYDYRLIAAPQGESGRLRAVHTAAWHDDQAGWLQQRLDERFAGKTVVITHMAPSMASVAQRFAKDPVSAAYASKLDALAAKADVWVHGHTHDSFDYAIGPCRVVCNPGGYRLAGGGRENPRFDPGLIVEI
jgi:hypothetical protein